jgi:diaminohydroxyphosphoribosylaminopyrimidine deaminase/5-amino-6-(5-phosphoribosylamino)uracil reductase
MVGAVLARRDRIIASGFHKLAGAAHAEIAALERAGAKSRGAKLYLNLEPCSHHGRTPPCADALIRAGVTEVIAGMSDPNPLVSGRGFERLRRVGIRVRVGLLEEECRQLNEAWLKYIAHGVPFVVLKLAATLDGKTASVTGDSRWISGERSRRLVHQMRNELDAVLVGAGTAIADDPQLTCRIAGGRNPKRVVLDGKLRVPLSLELFRQSTPAQTIVVTGMGANPVKINAIERAGAQVWKLPLRAGEVSWRALLKRLARAGIVTVLIEGGAATAASALKAKAVDKVMFFYAPKVIGGDGKNMLESLGIRRINRSLGIERVTLEKSGEDVLLTGYIGSDRST